MSDSLDECYAAYEAHAKASGYGPVLELWRDVQVDSLGLFYRHYKLARESFGDCREGLAWQLDLKRQMALRRQLRLAARNLFFYKKETITEPVILFTDHWSAGYNHWITETLPRLMTALEAYPEAPILIPAYFEKIGFIRDTLPFFVKPQQILFTQPRVLLTLRQVIFSGRQSGVTQFWPEGVLKVQEHLVQGLERLCGPAVNGLQKIFISRAASHNKRIVNEEMLLPAIQGAGFTSVCFDQMDFLQQYTTCKSASFLMGAHGAGLTNMLFMSPGATVIELRGKDGYHDAYRRLAAILRVNYHVIFGEPCDVEAGARRRFSIDEQNLIHSLQSLT